MSQFPNVPGGSPFAAPPYVPAAPGLGFEGSSAPPVVTWFKAFCALQLLFFGIMTLIGLAMVVLFALNPPPTSSGEPPPWLIGAFLAVLYAPFCLVHIVGVVMPRRKWAYTFGIVVCALSFVCGGCWFAAIPVLVYWLKPETRAWYESG